jgi:PAS domain-containing protein
LARKTRLKKKAELETLREQIQQLRNENERLKASVKSSGPKALSSRVLMECDFKLPESVVEVVDKLLAESAEESSRSRRSFCLSNPTAPDNPIVYASPDFVQMTGYDLHSVLGHNCRFLQGKDTDREQVTPTPS